MIDSLGVRVITQFSYALHLIDAVTGLSVYDPSLRVTCDVKRSQPIRKRDGLFIFTDLPQGEHPVKIRSSLFFDEDITIRVPMNREVGDIHHVSLLPNPSYPFPSELTLVRLAVCDAESRPVPGIAISVTSSDEACARTKLARDAEEGDRQLAISQVSGRVAPGDEIILRTRGTEDIQATARIWATDDPNTLTLDAGLPKAMSRGSFVLPVWQGSSDARGETVVALRGPLPENFTGSMTITGSGTAIVKEVAVRARSTLSLGRITLTDNVTSH